MLLPLLIILGSAAVGLLAGGRLSALEHVHLRWWALAPIGLAMQLSPLPRAETSSARTLSTIVLVASFPVLLAFVARNYHIPAFLLVFIGLSLNFAVIAANGGMPVSASAIRDAGGTSDLSKLTSEGDAKHHAMTDEDVLTPLGDVIAIGSPLREVLSPGDVLVYAGLAWFVIAAMRAPIPATASAVHPKARPRGYRGKHRTYRKPPPGAPLVLHPAEAGRSGTGR
jgi:hypothetical protein